MKHRLFSTFLRSKHPSPKESVIIVSGLPRSGTSMMMKILEAGGIEVLTDNVRTPDESNPQGYHEYERVKQLKRGDHAWLVSARGKVVKVISPFLEYLPGQYFYKVIFMIRNMKEILASQRQMLIFSGEDAPKVSDDELAVVYQKHLAEVESWLANQPNIDVLYISYNDMIEDTDNNLLKIYHFLGDTLDYRSMLDIVDKNLYRQRM